MPFSPLPTDFGGALRLYHVLKQLAARHRVTVLTFGHPWQAGELRSTLGLEDVRILPHDFKDKRAQRLDQLRATFTAHSHHQSSLVTPAFQTALDRLFKEKHFDVLHTEFSHLGPVWTPPGMRKVCDAHNVEYDVFARQAESSPSAFRRAHYKLEWFKLKRDETRWAAAQDALITTSDRDRDVFARDVATPIFVVPNGVDSAYFRPAPEAVAEPHSIVFTGAMNYVPNYDGIGWFVEAVLPKIAAKVPDVKLYVVGKEPPPQIQKLASQQVVVTGRVDDVRPYVDRCAAYVVPLRMGGGTRLKVVEAMAMRRPMVSTRIGAEGIEVEHGKTVLFGDTPDEFAEQTVKLLQEPALQKKLSHAAYALMQEKYEWSVIGKRLDAVYATLQARTAA